MKILLFLLLISFITVQAQNNASENLLSVKNQIKNSSGNISGELNFKTQSEFKKKNSGLAIVYSLLLPGMGELYADSYSSGKYFTIAEGALWGVYIGMNTYANWQKDRYISFAASNGSVNTSGKSDEYFATISEYQDINQYNNQKALEREFNEMYNTKTYYWKWSEEDRRHYRSMWVSSEQSFNNIRFVVSALILNRVISAVNAVRLVSAYNKRAGSELGWNLSVGVTEQVNLSPGLTINFQTSF